MTSRNPFDSIGNPYPGLGRRAFLRRAGLAVGGVAATGGLGGLVTACSSSSQGGGGSDSGQITVAISGTNAVSEKNWRASFAAFTKTNPKIKVNSLFVNANGWVDFFSALETQLAGGTHIDACYIPTEGMQLFSSRGLINPLDSYIAKEKVYVDALYKDINPTMLKGFNAHDNSNSTTYYLPTYFNTTCIYYNKKIFKANNVPDPKPDWSWDDFRDVCTRVSNKAKRRYGFLFNVDVWGGFEPWLTTNGASLMNSDWSSSAINSPQTVEAFTFCRSMVADNLAPSPSPTANGLQLMANGEVAMFAGGIIDTTTLSQYGMSLDDVAILPWPRKTGPGASVGIGAIAMLKASEAKDAVWTFIKYTTSPEEQRKGGGGSIDDGQLPIRTSASTSKELLAKVPAGADYFWKMLPDAQMVPGTSQSTAMEGAMDRTWSQVLTGAISPSAGAKQMESDISSNL